MMGRTQIFLALSRGSGVGGRYKPSVDHLRDMG